MIGSVRLKVTDRCAWACKWCHNEGTGRRGSGAILDVRPDDGLLDALSSLTDALGISEVHLTGGEPTLLRDLPAVTEALVSSGYVVKMTSVGTGTSMLPALANTGLKGVNFSLHSLSPESLWKTQVNRSLRWATRQLERELKAIDLALSLGLDVKVNTVVSSDYDRDRVVGVIGYCRAIGVKVRLLNDLNCPESEGAIRWILDGLGAEKISNKLRCCHSSYTEIYSLGGYTLEAKLIRDLYLPAICDDCPLRDQCMEKFYGLRMEKHQDGYYIRLCLHRSDNPVLMPVQDFLVSEACRQLAEGSFDEVRNESRRAKAKKG